MAGAVAAVAVAAVGAYVAIGRPSGLERDDPAGAKACQQLSDWIGGDLQDPDTGKLASKGLASISLGSIASGAKTPAIRAAGGADLMAGPAGQAVKAHGGPVELRFADLKKLHAGCVAAGVKMPEYAEPAA